MKKQERLLLEDLKKYDALCKCKALEDRVEVLENTLNKISDRISDLELIKRENKKDIPFNPYVTFTTTAKDFKPEDSMYVVEWLPFDNPKFKGNLNPYDYKKGPHRKLLLLRKNGGICTGSFYEKDMNHPCDEFAVDWLKDGFEGSTFYPATGFIRFAELPISRS